MHVAMSTMFSARASRGAIFPFLLLAISAARGRHGGACRSRAANASIIYKVMLENILADPLE